MVRRISGKYKASTVSHIQYNDNYITDVKEICNTLAERFAFNSSSENYNHRFNRNRLNVERKKIDFDANVHYSYNDVFTLHELKQAIKLSRDTSPGIVAQVSIISVTLFILSINSIASGLLHDMKCSLYVDDLAIYNRSSHFPSMRESYNNLSTY